LLLPLVISFHTTNTLSPDDKIFDSYESPELLERLICGSKSKDRAAAPVIDELVRSKEIIINEKFRNFICLEYSKMFPINDLER